MPNTIAISFDNTEYAFAYKKNNELKKARMLFTSMGIPWLINAGLKLTPLAIQWKLPFTKTIIRSTIFKQFVGGETLYETAAGVCTQGIFGDDFRLSSASKPVANCCPLDYVICGLHRSRRVLKYHLVTCRSGTGLCFRDPQL